MAEPESFIVFGRTPRQPGWQTWHHVAHRLAERHPVVFVHDPVKPVGRRRMELPDGVVDVVPPDYPLQRFHSVRRSCDRTGARRIRAALRGAKGRVIALVYPRARLETAIALRPDLLVYHATDDYDTGPDGEPDAAFRRWEQRMLFEADLVLAVSTPLAERLRTRTNPVIHLPNGYDEERFGGDPGETPPELTRLPRPILGFAGTVNTKRMDLDLLDRIAVRLPEASVVLLGAVVGGGAGFRRLSERPNVHLLGTRPVDEVPRFVGAFDAALVPYRDAPVNRAAFPLKILDALAMGRPVVYSPPHPDLAAFHPHARAATDADEFVRLLGEATEGPGDTEARRAAVADYTWKKVIARLEKEVAG